MSYMVVGMFDRRDTAEAAADRLRKLGLAPTISRAGAGSTEGKADTDGGVMDSIREFFADLFGNDDRTHVDGYAAAVGRGSTLVRVDVESEPRADEVRDILRDAGAIDTDETPSGAAASGRVTTAGPDRMASADAALRDAASETVGREAVIPVVREDLEVARRSAVVGGVRVFARAVERPVNETVRLREEHSRVDRRTVDRPPTPDRSTATAAMFDSDVAGFHTDWQSRYGGQGGAWEDHEPAYRYGHTMRSDQRYGGREWDDVEPDLRGDWQRRHPGSPWEQFKGSVQHAWDRMTDRR